MSDSMLHRPTVEGGRGFCGEAVPSLLPYGYHGPLVVALDSSILIDLQQHGNGILSGELQVAESKYAEELEQLGQLIDLWLLRDIRFIVTPRSYTDAKRTTAAFTVRRGPTIRALAESLAFQLGNWVQEAPSEWRDLKPYEGVQGLPDNADRALVAEAVTVGAHVFLTRDAKLVANVSVPSQDLRACMPSVLVAELQASKVAHFSGGLCYGAACPYVAFAAPGPDLGKWTGLLSIFD